jgi:hypothetical protein
MPISPLIPFVVYCYGWVLNSEQEAAIMFSVDRELKRNPICNGMALMQSRTRYDKFVK